MTTSQDVVVSEMGIGAAGAAMPGSGATGIFACRSAAGAAGAMSMRQTYLVDLAAAAARSASWVDAMRASSPTRSRAGAGADVDELTAWMVSPTPSHQSRCTVSVASNP